MSEAAQYIRCQMHDILMGFSESLEQGMTLYTRAQRKQVLL